MALITVSWLLDVTLILTSLMMAFYLYMTRNFNYWKKRNVKEFTPTPIFGNMIDQFLQKKSIGDVLKDLYEKSQNLPYVGFYIFDRPCLLIRDNQLLNHIFTKDFHYFSDRYALPDEKHDRLGYANIFFLRNPAWKLVRTKLTPFFTTAKLKRMFNLILDVGKDMDTYLASLELDDKGKIIDVKELAAKYATDMIGSIAYGLKVHSLTNPDAEFRKYGKKIFDLDIRRSFAIFAIFLRRSIVSLAQLKIFGKESTIFLRDVFWQAINHRLESKEYRNDLIDILIELRNSYGNEEMNGFKFDGDDLVAQAAIFFIGGFETTSTTLGFILYELALNPKIQDKTRQEIIDAIQACNGEITYDMVMSLPYLDMVISETLRLYPVFTVLDRIAIEDYKIPNSDFIIEKGTPIYIPVLGLHLDPKYFPYPLTFDPERFTEENKRNGPPMVYLPFGDGPRICIGNRLALLQLKLAMIKLLSNWEVTPCEKTAIPMVFNPKSFLISPLDSSIFLNVKKYH